MLLIVLLLYQQKADILASIAEDMPRPKREREREKVRASEKGRGLEEGDMERYEE